MRLIDISPFEIGAMSCYIQSTMQKNATTITVTQADTKKLPTIDAAPVVHGGWKINSDGYYPYCSVCGEEPTGREMTNFCPNCGAKMDRASEV